MGGGRVPSGANAGTEPNGGGRGVHKSTYRKWSSFLFAHCHNIHGIAPHGARHVIETAALAPISSSAVVQEGSLEDWWKLFNGTLLICDIVKVYFRVKSEKRLFQSQNVQRIKELLISDVSRYTYVIRRAGYLNKNIQWRVKQCVIQFGIWVI